MKVKYFGVLLVASLILTTLVLGCSSKPAVPTTIVARPPVTTIAITPTTITTAVPTTTTSMPPTTTATAPPTTTATNTAPPQTSITSTPPPTTFSGTASVIVEEDYDPVLLTITVGTTVTWTNLDGEDHTATEDNLLFNGFLAASGGTFSYTFTQAGTYTYYCFAHGWMVGKIIVV